MALRPFAIDELVINEGVDYSDANVFSQLVEATGLGQVQPQYAARHGARPVISGVNLPSARFFLESWFVDNYWKANKKLLYQYLNAERGETRRLLAGDSVPPGLAMRGCLLAMGPWDVYVDDDAAWHIRDLLQPDDVEADISGAVHFINADRTSAEVIPEATVNWVHNPVAGGASGYTDYGTGTVSRTSSYDLYSDCDEYAYQVDCLAEHDGGQWTLTALANAIHVASFWRRDAEALSLQVSLDGTNWHTATAGQTSGLWTRYEAQIPAAQANGSTALIIRTTGGAYTAEAGVWTDTDADAWTTDAADADAWTSFELAVTLILDGLQVEAGTVVTDLVWGGLAGYSWMGTAHNSATERDWRVDMGDEYDSQTRAIYNEVATTNMVKNPVAGASGNTGTIASGLIARSQDVYLLDDQNRYSYKITIPSGSGDGATWTLAALSNADHSVSFWQYGQAPNDLQVSLDNSNWHDVSAIIADGDWARYATQIPAVQANGSTTLYIRQNGAGLGEFYVDGVQTEALDWPTTVTWGAAGPGYSWSGTEHASSSSRLETEIDISGIISGIEDYRQVSVEMVLQFPYSYDSDEWPDTFLRVLKFLNLYIWLDKSASTLNVSEPGGVVAVIEVDAVDLGWAAGDWIHLVLSIDCDGQARLSWNGVQVGCTSAGGWTFGDDYSYIGAASLQANTAIARFGVYGVAMAASEVAQAYHNAPWRARWVDVMAEHPQPRSEGGRRLAFATVTPLAVDGDTRWRSRDGDVAFWRIDAATADLRVVVESDDEVYPELRITPTAAKSGGFLYKRFVPVVWNAEATASNYSTCIEPADLTGKAQADGDDVRVYVDGAEVDRWLGGTVPSAMKVWCYMDFEPAVNATLGVAIGSGDTITTITSSTSIADFPSSGILLIDSELFTYTGKNSATKTFTGVTRAARGTSAAAHTTSDTIHWIQHEVWLYYGDATLSAPVVDDDYEPAFDLDNSDNGTWDYDLFGADNGLRGMQWTQETLQGNNINYYTAHHVTDANPWEEIGIEVDIQNQKARFKIFSPLPITDVNFANGEKWSSYKSLYQAEVQSSVGGISWVQEYDIPDPSVNSTWESWSYNPGSLPADTHHLAIYIWAASPSIDTDRVECADVTLTLDSSETPDVTVGAEQANYELDCTITNEMTGEAITLAVNIEVDTILIVNTDTKTVRLVDGTKLQHALTENGVRRDWLRFTPGVNDLAFAETGADELEIDIVWDRRYFE